MRGWHKDAVNGPPTPPTVAVSTITVERVELYRHVPPPRQLIPMGVQPFLVDDSILEYKEIAWVVRKLRKNYLGGPSVMQVEHIHQWLIDATWYKIPDTTNCKKVIAIVQAEFHDGTLAEDSMWHTVFPITKGASGDFRAIGLVEVLWKAVTSLLN